MQSEQFACPPLSQVTKDALQGKRWEPLACFSGGMEKWRDFSLVFIGDEIGNWVYKRCERY